MNMKGRRSSWTFLIWPVSLLALVFIIWISGYLYWQIRISRAIAELKKGPARYTDQLFYSDPDLHEIGSRGVLRVLREWDEALSRGDRDQGFAFACGLQDLLNGASEVSAEAAKAANSYSRTRERPSMEEMREDCREFLGNWKDYEPSFAPWWQWWNGHELRRGYRRRW